MFFSVALIILFHSLVFGGVKMISINPRQTDDRIKTFISDSHRIFVNDQIVQRGELMIFLPASFNSTISANLYCSLAADAGYHVIALAYPGTDKMDFTCQHSTDPACYENFHREIVEGKNYSPQIVVDSSEGVFYRLKALLIYLNKTQPTAGWNEYLRDNNLKLSSMVWSGHSDGAGHVAVLAKYNLIKRAICFSGPKDFSLHYYLPPIWLHTGNWKTDKSKLYVFGHAADEYTFQKEIWDSLGVTKYGGLTNVHQNEYPFKMSHALVTSASIAIGDVHDCTILDTKTPIDKNKPLFESVWKYLLDIPLGTTAIGSISSNDIKIYPNPIWSGTKLFMITPEEVKGIELMSTAGQSIYRQNGLGRNIELPKLNSGLYYVKMYTLNGIKLSRIIVIE